MATMQATFPGRLREYCLRDQHSVRHGDLSVWAATIGDAYTQLEPYFAGSRVLHVSSVRRIDEETAETLRDA